MKSSMLNIFASVEALCEADNRRCMTQQASTASLAREAVLAMPYAAALRLFEDVIVARADTAPQATRKFAHAVDRHVDVVERV